MAHESTARLSTFVEMAPPGSLRALTALAAAESLSDDLAAQIVDLACPGQFKSSLFVRALHLTGFLVERNSEWHISNAERSFLNDELLKDHELFSHCHNFLAEIADPDGPHHLVEEVPLYLQSNVGIAYHRTALSPDRGLAFYKKTASGPLNQQWLAAKLATEQQDQGILSREVIEPAFLRGMVLYREGDVNQAVVVLRPVAYSTEDRQEVGIAAHLVGKRLWRSDPKEAERLLRRSLSILEKVNDRSGQAKVLQTLGQNLSKRNPDEAKGLLRKSLKLEETLKNRYGQAQVLHTLGEVLWKENRHEAESLLQRSLQLGESIGHRLHQAQVLHTQGKNLWRLNREKAETLLRRSLTLLESINNQYGQGQVLHTLGKNLWKRDPKEAERLLQRGLKIKRRINDRYGEAQVLHTLGFKMLHSNPKLARKYLERSLEIGEEIHNLRHQGIVSLTLGKLYWSTDRDKAHDFFRRSLKLSREARDPRGETIVKEEMAKRGIKPSKN